VENIVVLTGSGISAESGLKTFRDANGLWEGHDIMEVATPEGFTKNPSLVLDFYNQRRKQLLKVSPNAAHEALTLLDEFYNVQVITQNVDDLHERAKTKNVLHLHGELLKVRSTEPNSEPMHWKKDIVLGDVCEKGYQLRPHIVWFGEAVPMLDRAIEITREASILIIVGTSMQVYPAASLIDYVSDSTQIYFIDPKPSILETSRKNLTIITETAVNGLPSLVASLIQKAL